MRKPHSTGRKPGWRRWIGLCAYVAKEHATLKEYERLISTPSRWTLLLGKIPATRFWKNPFREQCRAYQDDVGAEPIGATKMPPGKLALDSRKAAEELAAAQASAATDAARRDLHAKAEEWRAKAAERDELRLRFSKAAIPGAVSGIEEPHWQKEGIWYDDELNALRSRLFAAALALHEAWPAEVTVKEAGSLPISYAICTSCSQGKRLMTPAQKKKKKCLGAAGRAFSWSCPWSPALLPPLASQFKELGAGTARVAVHRRGGARPCPRPR